MLPRALWAMGWNCMYQSNPQCQQLTAALQISAVYRNQAVKQKRRKIRPTGITVSNVIPWDFFLDSIDLGG